MTRIVSFGGKYELLSKLWVAIEGANTFQHVARIKFESLVTYDEFLSLKRGLAR